LPARDLPSDFHTCIPLSPGQGAKAEAILPYRGFEAVEMPQALPFSCLPLAIHPSVSPAAPLIGQYHVRRAAWTRSRFPLELSSFTFHVRQYLTEWWKTVDRLSGLVFDLLSTAQQHHHGHTHHHHQHHHHPPIGPIQGRPSRTINNSAFCFHFYSQETVYQHLETKVPNRSLCIIVPVSSIGSSLPCPLTVSVWGI
jgi:hypothetical protein